jgi:4-amino-4-deoxy-L-arabinose transferase-like glycosyltransferase
LSNTNTVHRSTARPAGRAWLRYWEWGALALIAVVAVGLRMWTLPGSLPFIDHPDEPNPVNYVVQMLRSGDPNPHAFQKPSFYVYLLLAVTMLHYRWGLANGVYSDIAQMNVTTHLYTTIPGFFVWGRTLTVALAALTVVFVFVNARRLGGKASAIIAALLVALSGFHLQHSQYVTTDVASGLLVLLTFGASVAVAQYGRLRDYLAAGVFAGLAASTKYNAGVAALMVATAHCLYWWRPSGGHGFGAVVRQSPRLFAAALASMAGFVVGTPYALLSWQEFWRGLQGQIADYSGITHGDFTEAWNVKGYFEFFANELSVVGLLWLVVLMVWRWRRFATANLIFLSFVVPYLLLHMMQSSHFNRNMLPVVVLAMLMIGVYASEIWRAKQSATTRTAALMLGTLLLLVPIVSDTTVYMQRQLRGDSRLKTMAWIDEHVPPGVRVAAEMRPQPGPLESRWTEAPGLLRHDFAWYRQQGYAYLVASSDAWKQWQIPEEYAQFAGQPPIEDYGGPDPNYMYGPHLVIYATGLAASDATQQLADEAYAGGARLVGATIGHPDPKAPQLGVLEPTLTFRAGDILGLRTFWQVEQPFEQNFSIFVHVVDASDTIVTQRITPPWQGRFPTRTWQPDTLVVDVNDIALPEGLAPGQYTIAVGMYDIDSGAQPPMSIDGQPVGRIPIATIQIEP